MQQQEQKKKTMSLINRDSENFNKMLANIIQEHLLERRQNRTGVCPRNRVPWCC